MATVKQHYDKGFGHFVRGELDEAIDAFKKALEMDETVADVWAALAETYSKKEMRTEAIEAGEKAVGCNPDDPMTHTALSRYYQLNGMIPEAEEEMARSYELQGGM